jgi:hypothetical protein
MGNVSRWGRAAWQRLQTRWNRLTHDEFANWASGFQSLLIAFGVLIGAAWSLYLYSALKHKDSAANMLLRNQTELQVNRLNLEKAQNEAKRAFGQVTLTALPLKSDPEGDCFLQVNAEISNEGTREIRLWFSGPGFYPPLNVARVELDSAHRMSFVPVGNIPIHSFTEEGKEILPLEQASLLPGENSTYPFLVRLPRDRIHLIQFRVPIDTAKLVDDSKVPSPDSVWFWAARTYVSGCSRAAASASESDRALQASPPARAQSEPVSDRAAPSR